MKTKEEIFDYLSKLPKKFKIHKLLYGSSTVYSNGIETALNASMITRFYVNYLKDMKKTTVLMPIPDNINPAPYDKLNKIIKMLQEHISSLKVDDNSSKLTSLLNTSKEKMHKLYAELTERMCFQLMELLLYEDIFNEKFGPNNVHEEVEKIVIPTNEEELRKLVEEFENKNSIFRIILFRADSYSDTLRVIEGKNV